MQRSVIHQATIAPVDTITAFSSSERRRSSLSLVTFSLIILSLVICSLVSFFCVAVSSKDRRARVAMRLRSVSPQNEPGRLVTPQVTVRSGSNTEDLIVWWIDD